MTASGGGRSLATLVACIAVGAQAGPGDPFADVEITASHVADHVYMLEGAGGNIAVSVGDDGVLMVDDQFAPLAERIAAAIDGYQKGQPRFVLNTHFHGDHTGGNEFFGQSGVIVAHDNVRVRLVAGGASAGSLPVVTFEDRLRIHFNGDEVDVIHLPRGHTDGDAIVWFTNAGVVHMGDHLFSDRFPYVDVESGGTVGGYLANLQLVLDMMPRDARVIPGHGPLGGIDALARSIEVIRDSQAAVRQAIEDGTLDALRRDGFGRWEGWGAGFISEERWIDIVVASQRAESAMQ